MESVSPVEEQIIKLTPENVEIGGFYKTTWKRPEAPHVSVPVKVIKYDEDTRLFHLQILTDDRPVETKVDYPLIKISEKEAGEILDDIRSHVRTKSIPTQVETKTQKTKKQDMTTQTEEVPATETPTTPEVVPTGIKKGRKPAGVPSLTSVARTVLQAGGTVEEAKAAILAQFPEANAGSVNSTIYNQKAKLAKVA